jgi:hypothetical protein
LNLNACHKVQTYSRGTVAAGITYCTWSSWVAAKVQCTPTSSDLFCFHSLPFLVLHFVVLCYSLFSKSCPTTCHAGAQGKRRYSPYSFLTLELDGCDWSASLPNRALPPGQDPRYPLDKRLGGPQIWSLGWLILFGPVYARVKEVRNTSMSAFSFTDVACMLVNLVLYVLIFNCPPHLVSQSMSHTFHCDVARLKS